MARTGRSGKPRTASSGSTPTASGCSPRSSVASSRVGSPRRKAGGDASLEYVLNDVAFCEIRRLEASSGKGTAADRWRDLSRRLLAMSDEREAGRAARARAPLRPGRRRQLRSARLQVRDRHRAVAARHSCSRRSARLREGVDALRNLDARDRRRRRGRARARVRRARHDRRHADALVEHGLAGDRVRPAARRAAAGDLRRRQEPVHEPVHQLLHAQPRRVPRRSPAAVRALQGRAQGVLDRAARARLPLAVLPRRHALALGRRREAPQARPARHRGHRVQEQRARGRAAQAPLHRAGDDQLPAHARGRDADRRLPRRDRQEPLHHRGRRVLARSAGSSSSSARSSCTKARSSSGSVGRSIRSATTSPTTASRSIARAASSIRRASCAAPTARSPTTISATPSTRARSGAGSPRCIRQLTVFHATHLLARVLYDELAQHAGTRDIYRLLRAPRRGERDRGRPRARRADAIARAARARPRAGAPSTRSCCRRRPPRSARRRGARPRQLSHARRRSSAQRRHRCRSTT